MSRTVNAALKAAALASQSKEVVMTFLTITPSSTLVISPIHLVNNNVDIVRNGITYSAFAFAITLPSDNSGNIGSASIVFDAVDQTVVAMIRSIVDRASISIDLALAATPNVLAVALGAFDLVEVSYNSQTVSGSLDYPDEDQLDYQYPEGTITPWSVPGSF